MMSMQAIRRLLAAVLVGLSVVLTGAAALADPPSRVARLGFIAGELGFSPAGEGDWVQASLNRPLARGDRLWAEADARAEIQIGGAVVRLGGDTGVTLLELDDHSLQLQLTQGVLNVRVRRLGDTQVFEVGTPNLAFTLRQPGDYRIEVDPDGRWTTILVRRGQGEVLGEGVSHILVAGPPQRFGGTALQRGDRLEMPRPDAFDRWTSERERAYDNSASARYVSPDVVGYQDLDGNGRWQVEASVGNVWYPHRVAADWAPYRDGRWVWIDPWGWTWIDDAPWGYAVSHYGRWAHLPGGWGWVPGPVRSRAYYAPALVVFVGGDGFQVSIGSGQVDGVAWFPLGPREVYHPAYAGSRAYFDAVNRSNTVISTTVIHNTYNTTNRTQIVYANRRVPGAVVAVPRSAFAQSHPVARAAVVVAPDLLGRQPVRLAAPVAPTPGSVHGGPARAKQPPERVFERPVLARRAPPAARAPQAGPQDGPQDKQQARQQARQQDRQQDKNQDKKQTQPQDKPRDADDAQRGHEPRKPRKDER